MTQPYYHLSATDLGDEAKVEPRVPSGPAIGEDRTTPRICVGMDIEDCIVAVTWVKATGRTFYVYQLADEFHPQEPPPWAVPDSGETRERWVTEPARFIRVGRVAVPSQEPWDWPDDPPRFVVLEEEERADA